MKKQQRYRNIQIRRNYRSTKIILSAANIIIKNNIKDMVKHYGQNGNEEEKIKVYETSSPEEEAEALTDNIISKNTKRRN